MTQELRNDFYMRLKELGGRKLRLNIDCIKFAFAEAYPDRSNHPERVRYLHAELCELLAEGLVRLPSEQNKRAWLQETSPKLPAWIVLRKEEQDATQIDPAKVPWLSEMSFCLELKNPILINAAVAINRFLIENRRNLIPVPMRERSLQIFNDEKRLDALVKDGGLFGGRLQLSSIGAFEVEQPLVHEKSGVNGKPVLVIENHHTYWSFCHWNSVAGQYSAIVYGCGNAFARSGRAIDEVLKEVRASEIEYFGDLDLPGLEIPVRFNEARVSAQSGTALPASRLYAWLITHGIRRRCDSDTVRSRAEVLQWLPEALQLPASELFGRGQWIPQESLGTEALITHFHKVDV